MLGIHYICSAALKAPAKLLVLLLLISTVTPAWGHEAHHADSLEASPQTALASTLAAPDLPQDCDTEHCPDHRCHLGHCGLVLFLPHFLSWSLTSDFRHLGYRYQSNAHTREPGLDLLRPPA